MPTDFTAVEVTLRIPGAWANPGELSDRMPPSYRLTAEKLLLPDGTGIGLSPRPPDDQFAAIFRAFCRRPAQRQEFEIVQRYTMNACFVGPGGSKESALRMLRAGAATIAAGAPACSSTTVVWRMVVATGRKWPLTAGTTPLASRLFT